MGRKMAKKMSCSEQQQHAMHVVTEVANAGAFRVMRGANGAIEAIFTTERENESLRALGVRTHAMTPYLKKTTRFEDCFFADFPVRVNVESLQKTIGKRGVDIVFQQVPLIESTQGHEVVLEHQDAQTMARQMQAMAIAGKLVAAEDLLVMRTKAGLISNILASPRAVEQLQALGITAKPINEYMLEKTQHLALDGLTYWVDPTSMRNVLGMAGREKVLEQAMPVQTRWPAREQGAEITPEAKEALSNFRAKVLASLHDGTGRSLPR